MKSYKDPWSKEIVYANDKTGRLSSVTGTSFGGVTSYASNPTYRAWGALKHLEYGSNTEMNVSYNNRLQPATHLVQKIGDPTYKTFDKTYEYYPDGRLKLADENIAGVNKFDRSFTYDHAGRIKDAKSGTEAHGTTETDLRKLPYRQSYTHNAFGNLTGRTSTLWNYTTGNWDFEPIDTTDGLVFSGAQGNWQGNFVGTRNSDQVQVKITVDGYSFHSLGRDGKAMGVTPSAFGGVVYIDSDISNLIAAWATAIHEIGNGLAKRMRDPDIPGPPQASDPLLRKIDKDAGIALEECVFGGYVGEDGYVYKAYRKNTRRR